MSFFNYQPKPPEPPEPEVIQEEPVKPTRRPQQMHRIILEGSHLTKVVEDNPEIPEGAIDVGIAHYEDWQPLNYDPKTMEVNK